MPSTGHNINARRQEAIAEHSKDRRTLGFAIAYIVICFLINYIIFFNWKIVSYTQSLEYSESVVNETFAPFTACILLIVSLILCTAFLVFFIKAFDWKYNSPIVKHILLICEILVSLLAIFVLFYVDNAELNPDYELLAEEKKVEVSLYLLPILPCEQFFINLYLQLEDFFNHLAISIRSEIRSLYFLCSIAGTIIIPLKALIEWNEIADQK